MPAQKPSNLRAWEEELKNRAKLVQAVASTPDGKALFDLLETVFESRRLRDDDPHQTYYNLGQRDVVQYLRELRGIEDG